MKRTVSSPPIREMSHCAQAASKNRCGSPVKHSIVNEMIRRTCSTRWLDENLELTGRGNYEILVEWLTIAAASDYEPVFDRVRQVLLQVGRMKYLRPLYKALGGHPRTQALAREVYAAASPGYHELSRRVSEAVIDKYDA